MLIMDTLLRVKDTIRIITTERNPAERKPKRSSDMLTTSIIRIENQDVLAIMSTTFSSNQNSLIYLLPLNISGRKEVLLQSYSINDFFDQLKKKGLKKIDINGSTGFGNSMLLANSGGKKYRNHLVLCDVDFWQKGERSKFTLTPIIFPSKNTVITGLTYIEESDMILFTASNGKTDKTNFAGSIRNARQMLQNGKPVKPDILLSAEALGAQHFQGTLQSLSVDVAYKDSAILYLLENEAQQSSTIYRVLVQFSRSGK